MCEEDGDLTYTQMLYPGISVPHLEYSQLLHPDQVRQAGSFIHFFVGRAAEAGAPLANHQRGIFLTPPSEDEKVLVLYEGGRRTRVPLLNLGIVDYDLEGDHPAPENGFSVDPARVPHILNFIRHYPSVYPSGRAH